MLHPFFSPWFCFGSHCVMAMLFSLASLLT
jgi:hypothetical protein